MDTRQIKQVGTNIIPMTMLGRVSLDRTAGTQQIEGKAGIVQSEQDRTDRTQQTGQPEHISKDRTARTGLSFQDRSARTGQQG
jgi:hypothetical protein